MNEILFRAHGRKACVAFCGDLTSGSVGLPIKFEFDSAWDGLQKTAIFKGSGTTVDVVLTGDTAAVPAEVMEDSGLSLKVGVWGADPDDNVVIPTVWVEVGKIKPGAELSGIDPHPPAPSWAAQVQQIATEALTNSEEAVATANATEARMTALEEEIAGDVEQAREYAQQAQAAAESAGADAQTASAAAQTAGSAASTASAAAATATEKAADTARDATAAQEAASEAETAKEAAETAAQSIQASAAQIEQNRQDIADLDTEVSQQKSAIEDLEALTNRKAGMLVDSVSGAIASFAPDATIPDLLGVTVDIEPVQDLHGYDSPWPAGGGANRFDEVWESGSFNGNTGEPTPNEAWSRSVNCIPVEPETSYYCNFEGVSADAGFYLFFYREDNSYISLVNRTANTVITTPAGAAKCKLQYKRTIETVNNYNVAVNYPSTVTTYSPYSNECPISGWDSVEIERTGTSIAPFLTDSLTAAADLNGNANWCDVWKVPDRTKTYTYTVYIDNRNAVDKSRATIWLKGEDGVSYTDGVARGGNEIAAGGAGYSTVTVDMSTVPNTYYLVPGLTLKKNGIASNPMLEVGSTASAYKPYAGNRYVIQIGQTVYGGTLDVTAGTLTVDRAMYVADGSESVQTVSHHVSGLYYTVVKGNLGAKTTNPLPISSRFKSQSSVIVGNCYVMSLGSLIVAVLPDQTATTKKAATQWFADNPTQFVYELATPITITLDPVTISTISGQTNNVWADAGDVAVEYAADLKTYINAKISALAAQIVNS